MVGGDFLMIDAYQLVLFELHMVSGGLKQLLGHIPMRRTRIPQCLAVLGHLHSLAYLALESIQLNRYN